MQDETGGVEVRGNVPDNAQPGTPVEAVGFPAPGTLTPILRSAEIRRTAAHADLIPEVITEEDALTGGFEAGWYA